MKCAVNLREQRRVSEVKKSIEEGYTLVKKEATNQTINYMLMAFATYLGDKRGWKPKRIGEALAWIEKFAIKMSEEHTTLEAVTESLKENYGLVFTDNGLIVEEVKV